MNIQDNLQQKELCEIIIRYLYGNDADVEAYKVFHDPYADSGNCDLRGVDVTPYDYTTEENSNKALISYDNKIKEAMRTAGFGESYEGQWWADIGESIFKAVFTSKASKIHDPDKSFIAIYQKS